MSDSAKKEIPESLPPDLPVLLIDALRIATRKDGLHLIHLGTMLPEGIRWQTRFMVPDKNLRDMIDALCSHSGYYPKKPDEK
jgi:hypothetical protein